MGTIKVKDGTVLSFSTDKPKTLDLNGYEALKYTEFRLNKESSVIKQLANEVASDWFGDKKSPVALIKACQLAIKELKCIEALKSRIATLTSIVSVRDDEIAAKIHEISALKSNLKSLSSKLNVEKHKCSAYKSILKDAIKKGN